MGIRDEVWAEVAEALDDPDDLGDVSTVFEYEDPVTGVKTPGRGWFESHKVTETDGESIQVTEIEFALLQNELAVTPEIDGYMHIDQQYIISDVEKDEASATWLIKATG